MMLFLVLLMCVGVTAWLKPAGPSTRFRSGATSVSMFDGRRQQATASTISSSSSATSGGHFNAVRMGVHSSNMALRFKVYEDEDIEQDEEEIVFDDFSSSDGGNSAVLRKIGKGVMPIASGLGFAVTPSAAIAARVAGGVAGGLAGFVMRRALLSKAEQIELAQEKSETDADGGDGDGGDKGGMGPSAQSITSAVSVVSANPSASTMTLDQLEGIARKAGVQETQLGEYFTWVFTEVVLQSVKNTDPDLTSLSEVIDFADSVGLSESEVGDGFALAAADMGNALEKDSRGFFAEEFDPALLIHASKIFFLADKMIGTSEGYYGRRLGVALSFFETDSFKEYITDACTALYKRCVEAVALDASKFSREEVDSLKEFLDVTSTVSALRPATMSAMVAEILTAKMDSTLGTIDYFTVADDDDNNEGEENEKIKNKSYVDPFKANLPEYENLQQAKDVLGWNAVEFDRTVSVRTVPLFTEAVKAIITSVVEEPTEDKVIEMKTKLAGRISALQMDRERCKSVITSAISEKNSEYMNRIDKVYEASGSSIEPAFKIMKAYASTHTALQKLTSEFMGDMSIPMPGLPFADMVRVSMYELKQNKLKQGQSTGSVSDDMFDLNNEQRAIVVRTMALPKITAWIQQCINEGNYSDGAKGAYEKLLKEYKVTDEKWKATAIDFYYQQIQRVSGLRQIPSSDDMASLAELSTFLACDRTSVERVNMEILGDKYVKALTEAMTPSGVITEEYQDGLDRLRSRLGLSEISSAQLLGVATRNRLGPVVKDLVDMWKSDTDASYRQQKEKEENQGLPDKSRDNISNMENNLGFTELSAGVRKPGGGPNVFMREVLNLVDFFKENYGSAAGVDLVKAMQSMSQVPQGSQRSEKQDGSESERYPYDVNPDDGLEKENDEYSFPLTAVGVVDEKDLVGIYKHFLLSKVSESDIGLKGRYAQDEDLFAALLGIPASSQINIKKSLAYSAYNNLLANMLRFKDDISAQDTIQFSLLKDELGLDPAAGDWVLQRASRKALSEHALTLIRDPDPQSKTSIMTAQTARRFRQQVQGLGYSMIEDTGCNEKVVTFMYALEVQFLIENGLEGELADIQEAYGIPEETASDIIEATASRYVDQILNFALKAARKYNEVEAVQYCSKVADYSRFISGTVNADKNMFTEDDKERMLSFYEASATEDEESGRVHGSTGDTSTVAERTARMRDMIVLTESYKPAEGGIDGLMGVERVVAGEEGAAKFKNTGW